MSVTNRWGIWIDSDRPVTGVVSLNNVEWIDDTIANGIDISYLEALDYHLEEEIAQWESDHDGSPFDKEAHSDLIDQWSEAFNDLYMDNGDSDYLIGDWIEEEGQYSPDTTGEYAAIVRTGSNVAQVVFSKFVTRCALCSPCYPGQGDLDTVGDYLAYDLPLDMYGEYRQNDNAQFAAPAIEEEAH